jgi:hypothetical protein
VSENGENLSKPWIRVPLTNLRNWFSYLNCAPDMLPDFSFVLVQLLGNYFSFCRKRHLVSRHVERCLRVLDVHSYEMMAGVILRMVIEEQRPSSLLYTADCHGRYQQW